MNKPGAERQGKPPRLGLIIGMSASTRGDVPDLGVHRLRWHPEKLPAPPHAIVMTRGSVSQERILAGMPARRDPPPAGPAAVPARRDPHDRGR